MEAQREFSSGACAGYRKDHLKAFGCGGSDAVWKRARLVEPDV
jgi:hypothetical protein